ncbi:MAG: 3,4-dihydroxy-2-butanone-4-phosphate synthase [Sphingomonadales bacterium]|nr:MAG: 3,4-dihydroxy-2-butanone-4-phosphate synthase [Sphingomonadales bacterium]
MLLALLVEGVAPAHAETWPARGSSGAVRAELAGWAAAPAAREPLRSPTRPEVVVAIRKASQATGVDFAFLLAQAHLESGLNPDARARSSSARGLYQFIDSTWLASFERNGARYGLAARPSRAALLALRSDPVAASVLAAADALDNGAVLGRVLGRTPTATELYLAHFLGSGGASRFLTVWQRAPQTSAVELFPRQARANRAIFHGSGGGARSLDEVLRALEAKIKGGLAATADLHAVGLDDNAAPKAFSSCFSELDGNSSRRVRMRVAAVGMLSDTAASDPKRMPNTAVDTYRSADCDHDLIRDKIGKDNSEYSYVKAYFSTDSEGLQASKTPAPARSGSMPPLVPDTPCDHIAMCYSESMSTSIITRVRAIVDSGKMTRAGLARAAGLHANTLRDAAESDWNPTAETLQKLEMFLDSNDQRPVLATVEEIIDEARNGRMYILVDDEDRENEGDLIIPAQMATPQAINFMATHGRGLICLALTKDRVDHLGLSPMSRNNKESMQTAFTISIEAKEGVTTGISAADRARTISVAIDAAKGADDLVTPGHVFPLMARDGGTLVRAGHTEAAVDISRLAGLNPSGVICEIMNDDGSMARLDDLITFARRHDLKIGTIRDLIAYRMRNDHLVERLSERAFTSDYGGQWRMITYRDRVAGSEAYVLQKGHVIPGEPTLARVHPISVFDDVLGAPGPRKRTLQRAMQAIGDHGSGVIVILTGRVGTGEWQASEEQRSIGIGSQILVDLGVTNMVLLSNSRPDLVALEGYGLTITDFHPIPE